MADMRRAHSNVISVNFVLDIKPILWYNGRHNGKALMTLDELKRIAEANLQRAYDILGARPGPSFDIEIVPASYPLDGQWVATPLTKAGELFLHKFYNDPLLRSNKEMYHLRRHITEWGLSYKVTVQYERITE